MRQGSELLCDFSYMNRTRGDGLCAKTGVHRQILTVRGFSNKTLLLFISGSSTCAEGKVQLFTPFCVLVLYILGESLKSKRKKKGGGREMKGASAETIYL